MGCSSLPGFFPPCSSCVLGFLYIRAKAKFFFYLCRSLWTHLERRRFHCRFTQWATLSKMLTATMALIDQMEWSTILVLIFNDVILIQVQHMSYISRGGSRIFQTRGSPNPEFGKKLLFCKIFAKNCFEWKKMVRSTPLDPPMISFQCLFITQIE